MNGQQTDRTIAVRSVLLIFTVAFSGNSERMVFSMAGKHYRNSSSAEPQRRNAVPQRTARTQVQPKKEEYEDLYSYEEPYGAKRGTRQSKNVKTTANVTPSAKKSIWQPLTAWLCLLAAAGILFYIVWDMGLINMVQSLLG